VKPLYYTATGGSLIVSNSLASIRRRPAVSSELDDLAISDFLLFGHNTDQGTTAFREIKRLPPGHSLTWSSGVVDIRKYWELPVEEPVYRGAEEYAEQLRELLEQAVADRLRARPLSIFLSGGLDSTALAAIAARQAGSAAVQGFTFVFTSLFSDPERAAAAAAAAGLGIATRFVAVDEPPDWPDDMLAAAPEPFVRPIPASALRCYQDMAAHSPIAFYGEGPDNALLFEWRTYLDWLVRSRRWARIGRDGLGYLLTQKRLPFLQTVRSSRARQGTADSATVLPRWISPELTGRLELERRLREEEMGAASPHPIRPRAHRSLRDPIWQRVFETFTPAYTGAPIEVMYPYLDLRVLTFLLTVPVVPWCRHKYLFRRAFAGLLPPAVLRRPKTTLAADPDVARVERYGLPRIQRTARLDEFGSADLLHQRPTLPGEVAADLRFVFLSHWLAQLG
jgi:asparagine synthase (glutamine-hydrolysing)